MILVRACWFATDKVEVREIENTLGIKFVGRDENRDQLSVVEHSSDGMCRVSSELLVCEKVA